MFSRVHGYVKSRKTGGYHNSYKEDSRPLWVVLPRDLDFIIEVDAAPEDEKSCDLSAASENNADPRGTSYRRRVCKVDGKRRHREGDNDVLTKFEEEFFHLNAARRSSMSGGQ